MTTENYVLYDVGRIFKLSAALYRLLPRVLRNSAKIAHYASVNVARLMPSGRAMFSERERHIDDIGISVECVALDDVASKADFIKIDTDGRELDILKGAKKLIQNGVQTIVEFSDFQYQSLDVLWRDAHTFTAELGFRPYVIRKDGSLGP